MNEPTPSKVRRLSELPRDIAPPTDGWPALEARLRESATSQANAGALQDGKSKPVRRWRPQIMRVAALAAVLAAVAVGISIDRLILSPGHTTSQDVAATHGGGQGTEAVEGAGIPVAYVTDPRYVHEREALLRSLNARLAKLPPASRQKVLQSLATIHQSMQQVQQALGREPGNALLQELLIDTYQDEMRVLSTVQEASGGSGET
ncbi:MAG TPA: hypothetical protein VGR92_11355 [Steroidobacteraceae bacterium]|nr:hypothetical protein [Steroidobacteraceae bacterium]